MKDPHAAQGLQGIGSATVADVALRAIAQAARLCMRVGVLVGRGTTRLPTSVAQASLVVT